MDRRVSIRYCWLVPVLFFCQAGAQTSFRTAVPQVVLAAGESFEVQYIIEDADKISNFSSPGFPGFRVVTGPHVYSGKKLASSNKMVETQNVVFTLAALAEGRFKIPGASCQVDGKMLRSNDAYIQVVEQVSEQSSYVLKKGEDPGQKIRDNLFLKLSVDKETSYVGEPIVATFKLYSRLQSKSNIVKNPGFYGFSVYDMVDVNDQIQSREKIRGRWFDVHTIRKVQLYPLQAGIFTIDPMELSNEVEFLQHQIPGKGGERVTENMYNTDSVKVNGGGAKTFELNISSIPIHITVKALPEKNMADTFAGAVGDFSISASFQKDSVLRNEEDSLVLEINGAGNFQRVNRPTIRWPSNFEVFDPLVLDTFDKQQVPLAGQRKFQYVFVTDKPGFYTLPPISFSFFNLATRNYTTVTTKPLQLFVSAKSKTNGNHNAHAKSVASRDDSKWILAGGAGLVFMTALLIWVISRRKRLQKPITNIPPVELRASLEDMMAPARLALDKESPQFFETLGRSIWNFLRDRLDKTGQLMIKKDLSLVLTERGLDRQHSSELLDIIHRCETATYTQATLDFNKKELLDSATGILKMIDGLAGH